MIDDTGQVKCPLRGEFGAEPQQGGSLDGMNDTESAGDDALLPRLRVIEDQPLAARADAYVQVYDQLRDALEGGDLPRDGDRPGRG